MIVRLFGGDDAKNKNHYGKQKIKIKELDMLYKKNAENLALYKMCHYL